MHGMAIRVAIHQPNFLPWLGFFRKWAISDTFVLLDDVQIARTGGSWTNRTAISLLGHRKWLTLPVQRSGLGPQNISTVQIDDRTPWKRKVINTFHHAYSACPFYDEAREILNRVLEPQSVSLREINIRGVKILGDELGLNGDKLRQSSTFASTSSSTQRLVDLVREAGGDIYLSGDGADGYQIEALFSENNIELEYLSFVHPVYNQVGASTFTAGLSTLDAISNVGIKRVRELIFAPRSSGIETR